MTAPAHPYDRHVGRYGRQLAAGLIDLAKLEPGERVLDVGCGTGQLTVELGRVVGAENVAAIDPAAAVVAVCAGRVPEADVRVGAAEALPFASDGFDATFAQLVVNLVDDPPAAVREMARVTRPAGRVLACVWDDREMPLLRSFWDAAAAVAPEQLAAVNDQARVGLSELGLLSEWWRAAGLRDLELVELAVEAEYADFDDLFASFAAGVGHSGALYVSLPPDLQAALRAEAQRRLGSPPAPFRLVAKAHAIRGTRSGESALVSPCARAARCS